MSAPLYRDSGTNRSQLYNRFLRESCGEFFAVSVITVIDRPTSWQNPNRCGIGAARGKTGAELHRFDRKAVQIRWTFAAKLDTPGNPVRNRRSWRQDWCGVAPV